MKTTKTLLIIIFSGFLLSMKCVKGYECNSIFYFRNGTDKPIYMLVTYDYPDTSMNFQNPRYERYTHKIAANTKREIRTNNCIENIILNSPGKKMSMFVFDAKLVDTTPWPQIKQNYQVLKRFDYTLEEMESADWNIDFQ